MFGLNEDIYLEVIMSVWVVVVEDRNINEVIQRVYSEGQGGAYQGGRHHNLSGRWKRNKQEKVSRDSKKAPRRKPRSMKKKKKRLREGQVPQSTQVR